jgi:hypothetical protein
VNITPPQQTLCADRTKKTSGPDPKQWLEPALPPAWRLYSFHFFVDWSTNPLRVSEKLLLTRLVHFGTNESPQSVTTAQLEAAFSSGETAQALNNLGRFSQRYGQRPIAVFLPEIPVLDVTDDTPYWTIPYRAAGEHAATEYQLSSLKAAIRRESGGPVPIGAKGLTYGTSALECALSITDAAYPGDVDAVIVDENGLIRCVIEFKKHTIRDEMGSHLANTYYADVKAFRPTLRRHRHWA